jgi:hypothetical protein
MVLVVQQAICLQSASMLTSWMEPGATTGNPYPHDRGSTGYTIPIADVRGRVHSSWLDSDANRVRVYQIAHGLTAGNVIIQTASMTSGTAGNDYIKASCLSEDTAETTGIVVEVINANEFVYVNSGQATNPCSRVML